MIEARVSVNLGDLSQRIGRVSARIHEAALYSVSEWLRILVRKTFTTTHASPEGVPWVPLKAKTAARKRGPGMLRESSALFDQVGGPRAAPTIEGDTVTLGSSLPYAAVHQFGFEGDESVHEFFRRVRAPGRDVWGKILGRNNKIVHGKIMMGMSFPKTGAHTRHAKTPARPYLPSPEFAQIEGTKAAVEGVANVLREEGIE
jgi:phage gpG-like protein